MIRLAILLVACVGGSLVIGDSELRRLPDAAIPVNLYELLGPDAYSRGVMWQPLQCFAPTAERMLPGPSQAARLDALEAMMMKDLLSTLSEASKTPVERLRNDSSFLDSYAFPGGFSWDRLAAEPEYRKQILRRPMADPAYWEWLRRLSAVVSRYTVPTQDPVRKTRQMACPEPAIAGLVGGTVTQISGIDCANATSVLATMGLFLDPNLPMRAVAARVLRDPGWCSVRPEYQPYGAWLKRERMGARKRLRGGAQPRAQPPRTAAAAAAAAADAGGEQRFLFPESDAPGASVRHKDRSVFLFDLLYESEHAFKRQHWLGSVVQQNPFDMYAIADIISTVAPSLIIETGTANGGSALMWASLLELGRAAAGAGAGPHLARVVSIDMVPPSTELAGWAGVNNRNPVEHPLWAKYVTFIQGSTLDEKVLTQVRQAAAEAGGPVLVLLDSDHSEHHVEVEARAYCPLVTNGSYCIVQDTKLSRFSTIGGPAPAVLRFLASAPEFAADRTREPFYSQHVGGYLRRLVKPAAAAAAAGAVAR